MHALRPLDTRKLVAGVTALFIAFLLALAPPLPDLSFGGGAPTKTDTSSGPVPVSIDLRGPLVSPLQELQRPIGR